MCSYLHFPSFIVMEFVTTKRRPKQFSMKVISMFSISEDKMVISSGSVREAAAASGSLCTLQVCTNIQKENIELLEMCFLGVGEQGISPQSNIKRVQLEIG